MSFNAWRLHFAKSSLSQSLHPLALSRALTSNLIISFFDSGLSFLKPAGTWRIATRIKPHLFSTQSFSWVFQLRGKLHFESFHISPSDRWQSFSMKILRGNSIQKSFAANKLWRNSKEKLPVPRADFLPEQAFESFQTIEEKSFHRSFIYEFWQIAEISRTFFDEKLLLRKTEEVSFPSFKILSQRRDSKKYGSWKVETLSALK